MQCARQSTRPRGDKFQALSFLTRKRFEFLSSIAGEPTYTYADINSKPTILAPGNGENENVHQKRAQDDASLTPDQNDADDGMVEVPRATP